MKDGNLYISGRDKEMIIVAGNKVFPAEVEDCLRQFPETKEIAVMGVPNTKLGQIVKAHIVLKDGKTSEELKKASQDEEALKACKQQLTKLYKEFAAANLKRELRPMEYQFYPGDANLPKTLSGKIDKKNLH
jgi:acyl-CoA synthetase (AMP-forming)/AMP-acid ligase II